MDRFIRPNMGCWFTYPMVCTQVIDLFIPTSGPNIFTDEFNGIKGFGKHGSIPTQPIIKQALINETKGKEIRERYRPFRKVGPDMHTDCLQPLPNRLFILIDHRFPARSTSRPWDKTGNWVPCRVIPVLFKGWRHWCRRWNQSSFQHFFFNLLWTRGGDCSWFSKSSNKFDEEIVHCCAIYLSYWRVCEGCKGSWAGGLKWWPWSHDNRGTKCDTPPSLVHT